MAARKSPASTMRPALLASILILAGCGLDDGDTAWSVTINSSPSADPVAVGQEVGFVGSYSASGTSVTVVTSSWSVRSGPGPYVLHGDGASASGTFSSPGTYVIVYQVTYAADDGAVATASSVITLVVLGATPG
jgi:surface-anchored protein